MQYPLCNPSRTSLLSGLRPPSVDVFDGATLPRHEIGNELRMLPEHFDDHGYFTARVGKVAHNPFAHRCQVRSSVVTGDNTSGTDDPDEALPTLWNRLLGAYAMCRFRMVDLAVNKLYGLLDEYGLLFQN